MKTRVVVILLAAFTAITVAACGSADTTPTVGTTASTGSSTAMTGSTQPATSTPSPVDPLPTDEPADAPEPVATPAQVTFDCGDPSLYQSGTALYSDGTTGYEAACDTVQEPPEKVLWYCDHPQTAVYTDGTSSGSDPACIHDEPPYPGGGYPYIASEDRNGDGVVNGYERCGLACGEEPTSGDIQTQYGCEEGYITGTLCEPYN